MPKLQEIFTTVAMVCHATTDSLFCKMFSPVSVLLIARKGVEKLFEETAYKEDKEKKEEAETKSSAWDLKILEQSSGTRQACVSVYFLNF